MKNIVLIFAVCLLCNACEFGDDVSKVTAPTIDKTYAYESVKRVLECGERLPDSIGSQKAVQYLRTESSLYADSVIIDEFSAKTPYGEKVFRNVIAEIKGRRDEYVIVGSHFDTKMISGVDHFVGANDGGSSTGALLAMMKAIKESKEQPLFTLRFVFFDGEECYDQYDEYDGLFGSKHYASSLKKTGEIDSCRALVLLDMIGDTSLKLTIPTNTDQELFGLLKNAAEKLNHTHVVTRFNGAMIDDFVPFQKLGVPCIDLIDFEFGPGNVYWHTSYDTLDKISPQSLKITGDLALQLLWTIR